jgi:hypothetical protein
LGLTSETVRGLLEHAILGNKLLASHSRPEFESQRFFSDSKPLNHSAFSAHVISLFREQFTQITMAIPKRIAANRKDHKNAPKRKSGRDEEVSSPDSAISMVYGPETPPLQPQMALFLRIAKSSPSSNNLNHPDFP